MGLIADFFVKMFGAIVSAIWQWLVFFQAAMAAALPAMIAYIVAFILPAPLGASVAWLAVWIEAINQWLPLSEAVLMGIQWIVFLTAWMAVRAGLKFFSLGFFGRA